MERDEEDSRILKSKFVLDHVGEVSVTLNSDGLSWTKVDSFNKNVSLLHFFIWFCLLFFFKIGFDVLGFFYCCIFVLVGGVNCEICLMGCAKIQFLVFICDGV